MTMLDENQSPDFIDVERDTDRDRQTMDARVWRDRYEQIYRQKWNPGQWRFINEPAKFCYLRSPNQWGKSTAAAGFVAYTATGLYPPDYHGWKPELMKDGPFSVAIWALAPTSQVVRDKMQTALLGDVASGNIGTGLIPKANIISLSMSRGIGGLVDFATIKRVDGSTAVIRFKSYEQGRQALQAEAVSLVMLDELLDDEGSFNELIARTASTGGAIRLAATERLQSSPVAKFFRTHAGPDVVTLQMTMDDATHLSPEKKAAILASYTTEAERNARYYGLPYQGMGSVFEVPIADILDPNMNPSTFPSWTKYLIALDFSHFGSSEQAHMFAAVFMAHDPMSGVTRIYDAFRMRGIPEQHVARIFAARGRNIPVAWPHDGTAGTASGDDIMTLYKQLGLRMLPQHAQFVNGGYNFESGIVLMNSMLATGKLLVATHLNDWITEYTNYERDDQGQVIKKEDDLMSATRIGCMSIRFARADGGPNSDDDPFSKLYSQRQSGMASGLNNWDIFDPSRDR